MTEAKAMLTIEETARFLAVTPETVRRLIRRGELRAAKIGKVWRVSREVLRCVETGQTDSQAASREFADPKASAADNPLARALAMVQARDAANPDGAATTTSAADELNQMRDERIAQLCHER